MGMCMSVLPTTMKLWKPPLIYSASPWCFSEQMVPLKFMALPREDSMDRTQNITPKTWIQYGSIGFLIGVCLVAFSAVGLFAVQLANPPATLTPLPTPTAAVQA